MGKFGSLNLGAPGKVGVTREPVKRAFRALERFPVAPADAPKAVPTPKKFRQLEAAPDLKVKVEKAQRKFQTLGDVPDREVKVEKAEPKFRTLGDVPDREVKVEKTASKFRTLGDVPDREAAAPPKAERRFTALENLPPAPREPEKQARRFNTIERKELPAPPQAPERKPRLFTQLQAAAKDAESVDVAFGEWLPDVMKLNSPGSVEALNVMPGPNGYAPFKGFLAEALTLPAASKGAVSVRTLADDVRLFAGTTEHLYRRNGAAFDEVYDTPSTLSDGARWQFIPFGGTLVALHEELDPVAVDTSTSSDFTALGGSPPKARCGGRVGDFLVLGNLDDNADGVRPMRVRWGGFNQVDQPWTTDPATQADFQDMPTEHGEVMAITGREFGTVFQERGISRMSYVGLPLVFEIETVETNRGPISRDCVVDAGGMVYFIAEDGFHAWNGTATVPIGNGKVDAYFFSRLNYAARDRIVGAHDISNNCIRWAFPVGGNTELTEQIIYNTADGRWTHAIVTVEDLFISSGLPLSLDTLTGNLDTDYPESFDTMDDADAKAMLAGFDSSHNYGAFVGPSLEATLDTVESTGPGGTRVYVNKARPIVDLMAPVATMRLAVRDQLMGETETYTAVTAQEITGECPISGDGRYVRFRVVLPAAAVWAHAQGVQVWRNATGAR